MELPLSDAWLNQGNHCIRNFLERFGTERAGLGNKKAIVGGKELGGPRVADEPKAAMRKIVIREFHSPRV